MRQGVSEEKAGDEVCSSISRQRGFTVANTGRIRGKFVFYSVSMQPLKVQQL